MSDLVEDARKFLVEGHLFAPSGKWKYAVVLDYTGILLSDGTPVDDSRFISPGVAALRALRQATERGISGVSLAHPGRYTLVAFDPPHGYPVLVPGTPEETS